MRNLIITSVALSIILGIFQWMFFGDTAAPNTATSAWATDLDAAIEEGRRRNRPVLALWTRDDSDLSVAFETDVLDAPVSQMAVGPFIPVRIEAAAQPELKTRLHPPGAPWIVIYQDGLEIDAFTPSPDADGFAAQLAFSYSARR
jgi:hypothetical protein